jgi:predicted Zn-dependent protease
MVIEWQGYYLDGQTAIRRCAAIRITQAGLQVITDSDVTLFWPYEEIRQTQGFYAGEQVRLERGGQFPEVLLVPDTAFLTTLHHLVPGLTQRFHNPEQRGTRVRLTIVAALATIAISTALYLWGIPALALVGASRVPVSWEEQLGKTVVDHLAAPERRCVDPILAKAMDEIMTTLIAALPNHPYKFRVFVANHRIPNALAAPGGYIVVFRGLLEETETAEELAGVLAHELQHVLKRHATRMLLQQVSTGLLLSALTGDVSGAVAFGLEGARTLGTLRYSRLIEEEADAEGMKLLLAAGIDPAGMISFFETMKKKFGEGPEILTYLSTHPNTDDRIEKLRSLAEGAAKQPVRLLQDYEWKDVKKLCAVDKEESQPK